MNIYPVQQDLVEYVTQLFAPGDDEMHAMTIAAHAFGMPANWEISPDVGKLFQVLCKAIGARRVLEVGTFAGHSALWFARALPDNGTVVSIELNPNYAAFAREQLMKTGSGEKIDIRVGSAADLLPLIEQEIRSSEKPFDVVFLDADKARYPEFLDRSVRLLRPGGLLLADNVLHSDSWNGQTLLGVDSDDPRILGIREFNRKLATHPQFTSLIVPMRSGVAVAIFNG